MMCLLLSMQLVLSGGRKPAEPSFRMSGYHLFATPNFNPDLTFVNGF
ncbi:hypothetical protein HMPREF0294_0401 [Corynebacterium glucuronolyticum ATCC 51867]|nr:hypothetical protein HMPREF0294_0401 [Corynebacterium glucuronolyticum ATCC 51867]